MIPTAIDAIKGLRILVFKAKTVNCNKVTYLKKDTSIELISKILDAHNRKLTGN